MVLLILISNDSLLRILIGMKEETSANGQAADTPITRAKPIRIAKPAVSDMNIVKVSEKVDAAIEKEEDITKDDTAKSFILSKLAEKQKSDKSLMGALQNMKRASLSKKNFEFDIGRAPKLINQEDETTIIKDFNNHIEKPNEEPVVSNQKDNNDNPIDISPLEYEDKIEENNNKFDDTSNNSLIYQKSPISKGILRENKKTIDEKLGVMDILQDKSKILTVEFEDSLKSKKTECNSTLTTVAKEKGNEQETVKTKAQTNSKSRGNNLSNQFSVLHTETSFKPKVNTTKNASSKNKNYLTHTGTPIIKSKQEVGLHREASAMTNLKDTKAKSIKQSSVTPKPKAKKELNNASNLSKIKSRPAESKGITNLKNNYPTNHSSSKAVMKPDLQIRNISGNSDYLNILNEIHDIFGRDLKKFDENRKLKNNNLVFFENLDDESSKNLIKSLIMISTTQRNKLEVITTNSSSNQQAPATKLNMSSSLPNIRSGPNAEIEKLKSKLTEKEDELRKTKNELRRIKGCVELSKSIHNITYLNSNQRHP